MHSIMKVRVKLSGEFVEFSSSALEVGQRLDPWACGLSMAILENAMTAGKLLLNARGS
jgi:hypothetical protein